MNATKKTFIGTCVYLDANDLDEFDDSSIKITNRTFRKHLGKESYLKIEKELGYSDNWLRLANDWHVSYAKGKWKGKTAICLFHSHIHHIWTIE